MAVRGRCLVTGATGYLGSALVPALLAADIPVRLLLRSAAHFEQYNTGAIECVAGDLTEDFPQDLCRDVDVVYHLAALAHTHASAAAYTDVNVTATRRLAEAARDPASIVVIDASPAPEQVQASVRQAARRVLSGETC